MIEEAAAKRAKEIVDVVTKLTREFEEEYGVKLNDVLDVAAKRLRTIRDSTEHKYRVRYGRLDVD